jgi:dihydroorotate dehydrogenase electron transfer subunit
MAYFREKATIVSNDAEGDARLLKLATTALAAAAKPFQFLMAKVPGGGRILRRPLSIFDASEWELELLVRPLRAGTARLCELEPGETMDVTGPLGRPFQPPPGAAFVAGGIGIAGVFYAIAAACRAGEKPAVFFGGRAAGGLYAVARLRELGARVRLATDDGSGGARGLVTDLLSPGPAPIIACGPPPMFAALRERLGAGAPLYLVMEERMACGVGACRACVAPAREPAGGYLAICEDGPVVDARTLDWARMEVGDGR